MTSAIHRQKNWSKGSSASAARASQRATNAPRLITPDLQLFYPHLTPRISRGAVQLQTIQPSRQSVHQPIKVCDEPLHPAQRVLETRQRRALVAVLKQPLRRHEVVEGRVMHRECCR